MNAIINAFTAEVGPCTTLSTICAAVANKLRTSFTLIHGDTDIDRVIREYAAQGETAFATLHEQLDDTRFGVTIRLVHREPWGMHYVSVIDCRSHKRHREYYTKWHELAHLLILTDQLRFVFRRTHEQRHNPEEQLIDLIAGRCAFHAPLIREHATRPLTFDYLERLRERLCPESSKQAARIGFVNAWPTPTVLIHAAPALKTAEEREQDNKPLFDIAESPSLRAVHVTANQAAREAGIMIFRNMRIPTGSTIARVFHGEAERTVDIENLAAWEATGKHLPPLIVRITAQRTYDGVEALIEPLS